MNRRALRYVVLALLATPLAFGSVLVTDASPPPEPICGVCGTRFVEETDEFGVEATVEHSELDVEVDDSGTGHWTARVRVDEETATWFRQHPDELDAIVGRVYEHRAVVDDPRDLTARMDGDTVVVTFAVPGMAHRSVRGVLLVDYFHVEKSGQNYYVDADRMTIRGPEGSALANDPPDASREDGAAVWTSPDRYTPLADGTYVAFGPARGMLTRAAAQVAIAVDVGPAMLGDLVRAALVPTVVLALGLAGTVFLARRREGPAAVDRLGYVVFAGAGLWLVYLLLMGAGLSMFGALGYAIGLQFLAVGYLAVRRPDVLTYERLLALAVGPSVLAVLLSVAAGLLYGSNFLTGLALTVGVSLFLPMGYAWREGRRSGRYLLALILAAPTVAALPMVPVAGFGPSFLAVVLSVWAATAVVVGVALFWLGRTLVPASQPRPTSTGAA